MNNLDAMNDEERQRTMMEMEQWGCDVEKVREYRAKHEHAQAQEKVVSDKRGASKTKKRKEKQLDEEVKQDVPDKTELKEHNQAGREEVDEDKSHEKMKKRKIKGEVKHNIEDTVSSKDIDQPDNDKQHEKKKKRKTKLKEKNIGTD